MLDIRASQLAVLQQHRMEDFKHRLLLSLLELSSQFGLPFTRLELRAHIENTLPRAAALGLDTERQIYIYGSVTLLIGERELNESPSLRTWLADPSVPPSFKVERLLDLLDHELHAPDQVQETHPHA